jgi:zinc protease
MLQWRLLAVLLCVSCGVSVFADEATPQQIRSVEGITEYRLDNGLQVLLFPDASRPTTTVNLTLFVGSRHEGYGEAGMAHLLEHMVFKGTPSHEDIPALLTGMGASFNGTTWLDRTNYYETFPASAENLETAIRLEADRMVNSYIKGEDLASEMTVVRNEFERGENSPQSVLMERMFGAAFEWHNYGKSTIGNRADIERVPVENLRHFYQRFYQPDNAMLIVAGRFDDKQTLALIQKYFGAIPRPERTLNQTYTEEPAQDGERLVTVRRVGTVPLAGLMYHIPAGSHPDFAAIDVLTTLMTSEPSGRLYESLVKRRVAASAYGVAFGLHDPGVMLFAAEAAQGTSPADLLQQLIDGVEGAASTPFTPEEVERARQELLRQRELAAANSTRIAIQLSDWAAQGDWRLYFLNRDQLEAVTPADVQRVAESYMVRNNRTAGVFEPTTAPERSRIPATPDLLALLKDYKGREAITAGEQFNPDPMAIEARLQRGQLTSGIKLIALPKSTRGSTVELRLKLRYGTLQTLMGNAMAAQLLPSMLMRGTENLTRQQISDELDNYRARMSASGDAGNLTISIQTRRENLVPVLGLMEEILRRPSFPEEELALLKEEEIASASQMIPEPQVLASRTVQRKLDIYPRDDPRYVTTPEEDVEQLEQVDIAQIRDLYQNLLGSGTGELAIVGDFSLENVQPVIDRMLQDWNSPVAYDRISRDAQPRESGEYIQINTPDKANAVYFAATTLPMTDAHPDFPALTIGNFILGGGSLSSRLANRVRQKEGLSYGVQSALQPSAVDQRTAFYIFAISNPANAGRVHEVIQEELKTLIEKGITEEELAAAKRGYLNEQEVARSSDARLVSTLLGYAYLDRDMAFIRDRDQKIASLTVEQVNAAIQKYIDPDKLIIASAGDFEAAAKEGASP